jgi:quercetin dioxygenase-like cupin family protein
MLQPAYVGAPPGGISVFDATVLPWQDTPDPGLRLKPIRYDDERGHFLGLVGFAPLTRSGLHQHHGVATSFVVDGALHDYQGSILLHHVGINLRGATHDAYAYQNTVLVSRLEGPVVYPPERGELSGLHAGSRHAVFDNPAPEVPPDINVDLDRLAPMQTGVAGMRRQVVFDYAGTGSAHRMVQLSLAPGVKCPPWRASARTEFWVRGGLLQVGASAVHGNCFVVIEEGTVVELASPFGVQMLAWAEGPEQWQDAAAQGGPRSVRSSLFGF